jgi:hypothetical protein
MHISMHMMRACASRKRAYGQRFIIGRAFRAKHAT